MAEKRKEKHEETRKEIEKEEEMEETAEEKEEEKTDEEIEKEVKEPEEKLIKKEVAKRVGEELAEWVPKTELGKEVVKGKYKDLKELLDKGGIILEPEIVDYLVPEIKEELIYVGGTPGKGGGIRRTPTRMTARMHKSGRRFKLTALVVVGNEDGVVGVGKATSNEHRVAIEKANAQAKLNVINVRRGCGSWECNCGGSHSIPFRTEGKVGSVKVMISPTPTGVGIVADDETKKILRLAGIKDVWIKTFGMTSTRINLAFAVFEALKNLSVRKGGI